MRITTRPMRQVSCAFQRRFAQVLDITNLEFRDKTIQLRPSVLPIFEDKSNPKEFFRRIAWLLERRPSQESIRKDRAASKGWTKTVGAGYCSHFSKRSNILRISCCVLFPGKSKTSEALEQQASICLVSSCFI